MTTVCQCLSHIGRFVQVRVKMAGRRELSSYGARKCYGSLYMLVQFENVFSLFADEGRERRFSMEQCVQ